MSRFTWLVCVFRVFLVLRAAAGDNTEEQKYLVTISDSDEQALKMMKGVHMDDLRAFIQAKTESLAAENESRGKRGHNRSRRTSRRGSTRQLGERPSSILRELGEDDVSSVLNTMWLLFCGTFVFFMHAGFAMLECGTGRYWNVQAILIKNLLTVCMGTIGWYILGWSLAYGGNVKTMENWKEGKFAECPEEDNPMGCPDDYADNGFIGGAHMFFGSGFLGKGKKADALWAEGIIKPSLFDGGQAYMWFFQWAFCTAGASIVSGGIAERVRFPAYMLYAFCMSSFIYPVVVCSTWGYGWLETFKKDKNGVPIPGGGYIDFAGSGVVHLTGGIGALVGAFIVGPRKDRWDTEKEADFAPHAMPLIVLGTFILWFGWCGFNSGSTLAMADEDTALMAAHVMMNTTLSAATGGLTVFLLQLKITRAYDCAALCNGILAGLVSITAGCGNVESGSAVLSGMVGGCIFVLSSTLVKKAKIDDPVDAFSVHGACGIWGCMAAALLDFGAGTDKHHGWGGWKAVSWTEEGDTKPSYMTCMDAFAANMCEVAFVIGWSGGLSALFFGGMKVAGVLRVSEQIEMQGLDASECACTSGYRLSQAPATDGTPARTSVVPMPSIVYPEPTVVRVGSKDCS